MERKLWVIWVSIVSVIGLGSPSVAAASVNDFRISQFQAEYHLSRDAENRSQLKTVETITAQFPDYDQNHGLIRAIPKSYDGHPTNVQIISVTDEQGNSRTYDTSTDDNSNLIVRMADMNKYVHGAQTYKLTYTQRDVTRFFADTKTDEFYWDTNGTQWKVPIDKLSIKVTLDETLSGKLTGKSACYFGAEGSTDSCQLQRENITFAASATSLQPGDNMTVAFGFQPGTFAQYEMSWGQKLLMWWGIAQGVLLAIGAAVVTWIGVKVYNITNRSKELGTIIPEYLPPHQSAIVAAAVAKPHTVKGSVMVSQLLELAITGYIKLYEVGEKKWYSAANYEIEVVKPLNDLPAEVQGLLTDMFGDALPAVGSRLNLKSLQNNVGYARRTMDDDKHTKALVRGSYGLRVEKTDLKAWLRRAAIVLLIATLFTLSPILLVITIIVFALSFDTWQLTDAGLALRRYLEGLKMYIKVAEQDRIKMLQSPECAQKIASVMSSENVTEPKQLVKLYESVLPYAVLFGQEKEWTKQLGSYYEQTGTQPGWYMGSGAFNAAAFSSGMSGLSQAASYASSSSSSTGGSGGGGSSGGGGGGGGGGGV